MKVITHPGFAGFTIIILPNDADRLMTQISDCPRTSQLVDTVSNFYDEVGLSDPSSALTDLLNHWLTARHKEGDVLQPDAIVEMVGQVSRLQRFLVATYEQSIRIGSKIELNSVPTE